MPYCGNTFAARSVVDERRSFVELLSFTHFGAGVNVNSKRPSSNIIHKGFVTANIISLM